MSKRIYIAAPWASRSDVPPIAKLLEQAGHVITHKWWEKEEDDADESKETYADSRLDFLCECAIEDMRGVRTADAVLLINSSKSEGKAVEQGLALAYGVPIIAVGVRGVLSKNVFHYLPDYTWVANINDALQVLRW